MPGPTVESGWEKVRAGRQAVPPDGRVQLPRGHAASGLSFWGWAMPLGDLWRLPGRAGKRMLRTDLVLIPVALAGFLCGWAAA